MNESCYDIDPQGDVTLILSNPNGPFAVWTDFDEESSSSPTSRTADTSVQPDTFSPDTGAMGIRKKKKEKKRRKKILQGHEPWELSTSTTPFELAVQTLTHSAIGPSNEHGGQSDPTPDSDFAAQIPVATEEDNSTGVPTQPDHSTECPVAESGLAVSAGQSTLISAPLRCKAKKQQDIRLTLSSRHLILASPIFRTMLTGCWQESRIRSENKYLIELEDYDANAFMILMNVIHGRIRSIPRSIDLETLAKIAVLVDYYDCHEVVELATEMWIKKLKWPLPTTYCRDLILWLHVSWVFCEADIFEKVTKVALETMKGQLCTMRLPIPENLIHAIDATRRESMNQIFKVLQVLLEDLRDGREGCSFECSSILLGALMKGMHQNGMLEVYSDSSLEDFSFKSASEAALEIRSPRWRAVPSNVFFTSSSCDEHACDLQSIIRSRMGTTTGAMVGLKLHDFKGKKTPSYLCFLQRPAAPNLFVSIEHVPCTVGASQYRVVRDGSALERFQHICAQPNFLNFSPEELRWGHSLEESQRKLSQESDR